MVHLNLIYGKLQKEVNCTTIQELIRSAIELFGLSKNDFVFQDDKNNIVSKLEGLRRDAQIKVKIIKADNVVRQPFSDEEVQEEEEDDFELEDEPSEDLDDENSEVNGSDSSD